MFHKFLTLKIWILLVSTSFAWAAPTINAFDLYEAKQYKQAYQIYSKDALRGDPWARYVAGFMLIHGQGVKQDRVKGIRLITLAAQQGEIHAMHELMEIYGQDLIVPMDMPKAIEWARKSDESGAYDDTSKFIANALSESNDKAELDEAIERFNDFINEDETLYFEQYRLGLAYANRAKFVPSDSDLARQWLKVAERNSPPEFVRYPKLGISLFLPDETPEVKEDNYKALLNQAEKGDADAQYRLSNYFRSEKEDYLSAYQWLKKAAAQQHADALSALGHAHEDAMYCLRNIAEGRQPNPRWGASGVDGQPIEEWSELQCPNSGLLAEKVLVMSLSELEAQENRESEAAKSYFAQAAALNQPDALYQMFELELDRSGSCILWGEVKPNCVQKLTGEVSEQNKKAFAYLLKAGELGLVQAFGDLGAYYFAGEIVPQNLSESLRWYQKSADAGIWASANLFVAQFYCKGLGVPKNDDWCSYHLRQGYESVGDEIKFYAEDMGLVPYVKKFLADKPIKP